MTLAEAIVIVKENAEDLGIYLTEKEVKKTAKRLITLAGLYESFFEK